MFDLTLPYVVLPQHNSPHLISGTTQRTSGGPQQRSHTATLVESFGKTSRIFRSVRSAEVYHSSSASDSEFDFPIVWLSALI